MRKCKINNSADTMAGKEQGERCAPGTGAENSLQPMEKTLVMEVVPLKPIKVHGGADIQTTSQRGSHAGSGEYILKEAAACGKPMQEQVFWQK